MENLIMRLRGALGMGLTWAVGGATVGVAIELVHNVWPNPLGSLVDIWPAALAYPAFVGGLIFSGVLAIAGRHRRFHELSLARFAAWGAVGGLLASLIPAAMVGLGLATPNVPLWQMTAALAGPLILGSALAATTSLAVARLAEDSELLEQGARAAEVGLSEDEVRTLLSPGADQERP